MNTTSLIALIISSICIAISLYQNIKIYRKTGYLTSLDILILIFWIGVEIVSICSLTPR